MPTMPTMAPLPHQIDGARFLAARAFAVLADEPRVGKTGAAVMAADLVLARSILIVTTASGRAVLAAGVRDWTAFSRTVQIVDGSKTRVRDEADTVVVGWGSIATPALLDQLLARAWDVLVLDESHNAKSITAKRTQAALGAFDGPGVDQSRALAGRACRVWCLTGTPVPNSPLDLFPVLRVGAPERIEPYTSEPAFLDQFCRWRPKKLNPWTTVRVIMGGKNEADLRARLEGLILRRTQADVGITGPIYEALPILVPEAARRRVEAETGDAGRVLAAIDAGDTRSLEMHLGPLRRVTGALKAAGVVDLVKDEFNGGLDRIVLAYWHREVADALAAGLSRFGVVGVDGSVSDTGRSAAVSAFSSAEGPRVFLAQIQAAGEAIDLSASAELIFVEMSFTPKDGQQMALRVTNHNQKRRPRVRVAAISGSIDEAIQSALLRKMNTIKEILN